MSKFALIIEVDPKIKGESIDPVAEVIAKAIKSLPQGVKFVNMEEIQGN